MSSKSGLTNDVGERHEFAEEVFVCPEVVVLEVRVEVVEEEFLLRPLLGLRDDAEVEVHHQGLDFAGLPVFP